MTGFDLLTAMNDLDEDLVVEAAKERRIVRHFFGSKAHRWSLMAAAAACLVLAVGIGLPAGDKPGEGRNTDSLGDDTPITSQEEADRAADGLPKVEARIANAGGDSYGLWEKSITEVTENSNNPWTKDCSLTSLPVYENLAYTGGSGETKAESKEELLQLATTTAESMGRELGETEYQFRDEFSLLQGGTGEPGKEVLVSLTAKTTDGQVEIQITGDHEVSISDSSIEMPEEYWTIEEKNVSDTKAQQIGEFYLENYAKTLDFEQATLDFLPSYDIYGRRGVLYVNAFDNSGDELQRILNYNFSPVRFSAYFDEESAELNVSCSNALTRSEKLGDYPIITWEDAQEKILAGEYVDAGGYKPAEESIKDVELVYWVTKGSRYYIPYYRFYVELDAGSSNWLARIDEQGLKQYEACYVPAVEEEYIADLEGLWDGSVS